MRVLIHGLSILVENFVSLNFTHFGIELPGEDSLVIHGVDWFVVWVAQVGLAREEWLQEGLN